MSQTRRSKRSQSRTVASSAAVTAVVVGKVVARKGRVKARGVGSNSRAAAKAVRRNLTLNRNSLAALAMPNRQASNSVVVARVNRLLHNNGLPGTGRISKAPPP